MNRIDVVMMTRIFLGAADGVSRLLDAFDAVAELSPTHWGPDERAQLPFDRAELSSWMSSVDRTAEYVGLRRQSVPRYAGYFNVSDASLSRLKLTFNGALKPKARERVFALGDALARALTPEFGGVNVIGPEVDDTYGAASVITAENFQSYGPLGLCTRTWLGSHLVGLFGKTTLESTGGIVTDVPWGGARIDVIDRPWEHSTAELFARWQTIMQHLKELGVFGDYARLRHYAPGRNWQPVPIS